jgi:DNA-binding transcriptional MerR regulator
MSSHILSLFGDEIPPEELKAVGKSRAPKKEKKESSPKKKQEEEEVKTEPAPLPDNWKADKQYYSIGEVASLLQVNTSNVRFWTKEFNMKVRTTRKGDRLYNPEQVQELKAIYHLVKERGFTINGARANLKSNKKSAVETVDLKQSLLQLRNKLLQVRNSLK